MVAHIKMVVRAEGLDQLRALLQGEDLDLNCGGPQTTSTGELVLEAYGSVEAADRLRSRGARVDVDQAFERRSAERRSDVGSGDRYRGGLLTPRGTGRKE